MIKNTVTNLMHQWIIYLLDAFFIGTLTLALAISTSITPIFASMGEEPIALDGSNLIFEYTTISVTDTWEDKINYMGVFI
ncbi:MAG: hypothetical protein WDA24_04685 [Tissierellales bacterium]